MDDLVASTVFVIDVEGLTTAGEAHGRSNPANSPDFLPSTRASR
jgi:hypothetical protein